MDKFFESVAKLSLLVKTLVLVVSVSIVVAIFLVRASYSSADPKAAYHRELANLRRATQELSEAERAKAEEKQDCEQLARKLDQAKRKMKRFRGMLPDDAQVSQLIKEIKAKLSGLALIEYARLEEEPEGISARIPLDLTVEGTFHQLLRFLHEISSMPRIVNVTGIKITDPRLDQGKVVVRVSFRVSTFRYLKKARRKAKPGAAGGRK
jgi:type IV pilus assembly protein PilO